MPRAIPIQQKKGPVRQIARRVVSRPAAPGKMPDPRYHQITEVPTEAPEKSVKSKSKK